MARISFQLAETPRNTDEIRNRIRKRMERNHSWRASVIKILDEREGAFAYRRDNIPSSEGKIESTRSLPNRNPLGF